MRDALLSLIKEGADLSLPDAFNTLAIRLFCYQLDHNPVYQRFVLSQQRSREINRWEDIPPLPIMAFRFTDIKCRPLSEAQRIFYSSGTTGEPKSQHPVFDLEIATAAILSNFDKHLMPEGGRIKMAILTPSPSEAPHASLVYMMDVVCKAYGTDASQYYVKGGEMQTEGLVNDLQKTTEPIAMLGTSLEFVHLIDFMEDQNARFSLPAGSRLMDTGGFKGRSREVSRPWLLEKLTERLGIPPAYCVNEYGMAEMTSQFYDGIAGLALPTSAPRFYTPPAQVQSRVLSLETLEPAQKGEVGLLAHCDLANIDSVIAILTEDLGREVDGGFQLIGRAPGAIAKGCSMNMDEWATAGFTSEPVLSDRSSQKPGSQSA